jgi:hypothetical protein
MALGSVEDERDGSEQWKARLWEQGAFGTASRSRRAQLCNSMPAEHNVTLLGYAKRLSCLPLPQRRCSYGNFETVAQAGVGVR